mgnify:CR=1 FL=1
MEGGVEDGHLGDTREHAPGHLYTFEVGRIVQRRQRDHVTDGADDLVIDDGRAVKRLAGFLGRSPDTATVEDLRRFQLYLVDHGTSPITLNATLAGLKFFFEVTLDRPDAMARMSTVRVPRKLPVILSRDEATRLIAAAGSLKYQTALSVAYGAGLR